MAFLNNLLFVFIIVFFAACNPKETNSNTLPNYSDMGAAADAGRVQP